MPARNLGILDSYFAGAVAYSKLSDKVLSFGLRGENLNVGTGAIEDVWQEGGRLVYPLIPVTLDVSSTNISDTGGGAGIQFVKITGCDGNFKLISETLVLNGTTVVVTVNQYYRVFSMVGGATGVADLNTKAAGKISAVFGADVQASILAGTTTSRQAFITILDGYTGFISTAYTSGGAGDDFIMNLAVRSPIGIFISGSDIEISNSSLASIQFDPSVGNMQQHSDVKVECRATTNNAQVRINIVLTMIENKYLQSLADSV